MISKVLKKGSLLLFTLFIYSTLFSQDRYIIFLRDKANNPFSINNPSAYLSPRAIQRRSNMGIAIDQLDIPITPSYLTSIKNTGVLIINKSKWLNSITVEADTAQIINVGALPFVTSYRKVFGSNLNKPSKRKAKFEDDIEEIATKNSFDTSKYGGASNQTKMLSAELLHQQGFRGSSTIIAIIDAGFRATNTHPAFDSLRNSGRILGTWDFSNNNAFVYDFSNHGTSVLSCIAANVPDSMIGMAPDASFYLLRSEEEVGEYLVEEYNWAAAAEFADSVGADIINSSLGYTEFDAASQNHTYADMNGNTAPCTIAADIAVDKGVLVINSAGNSGTSAWFFIGAPADGDNVFSIGAVNPQKTIASFSSNGPTADGRIKPDVVAQGGPAWIAKANTGSYGFGNGTSFSGPIMAGFSACAMELYKISHPSSSALELKNWIKTHSDKSSNPDNQYGFGIPNASLLLANSGFNTKTNLSITLFPNPSTNTLSFDLASTNKIEIRIYSMDGRMVEKKEYQTTNGKFTIPIENLLEGMYVLKVIEDEKLYSATFIKSKSDQ